MNPERKLLILTYHFPPSSAVAVFRMLGFARHLPRCGWKVGVVAPPRVPGEPVDEALLERVPPATVVFPANYPRSPIARIARRLVFNGVWLPRALPAVHRAMRVFKPDAVLTSGPPHCINLLGLLVKHLYGVPWVADLRDPWFSNCDPEYGWFPGPRWERFWETRMMRAADVVLANTPLCCGGLRAAYPQHSSKIDFVTNGFDPEFFPPPAPLRTANPWLTIVHAGEMYHGRNPGPFFDALRLLEQARSPEQLPVRVRLLGRFTEDCFDPRPRFKQGGLEHLVEVAGQVPYAEALQSMHRADILLLLDRPGKRVSIPAKLFEYFGAARPILALCEPDSDTAWALQASGLPHRIVAPLDVAGIVHALSELRAGLERGTLTLPAPQQLAAFTRANLTEKLAGHLDRVLAVRQPVRDSSLLVTAHDARERYPAAPTASRPHYVGA
jgi:glycosyltransferase involved in cell wall biosynthesis